jgi:hypothetical protein
MMGPGFAAGTGGQVVKFVLALAAASFCVGAGLALAAVWFLG